MFFTLLEGADASERQCPGVSWSPTVWDDWFEFNTLYSGAPAPLVGNCTIHSG